MRRVCVLGSAMNETNVELVRNWRELGLDATLVSQLDLERGLPGGAVVVGRLDVLPTLEGVEPGLLSLFLLERSGGRVLNRAGMLAAAHDKLVTARILGRAELPHPRTAAMRAGEPSPLSPPLVLKPRLGSWGRDVFRCRDWQELERTLAVLRDRSWFQRHGTLVQELVPSLGYDLRLILAGGRVVGAGERVAVPGEWRTNISLGGSFRPAEPPEHARLLAIAAASALDADLVGVDLMPTTNGYLIVELNGAVDFDQRYSLDGQDLFLETARALGLVGERSAVPV